MSFFTRTHRPPAREPGDELPAEHPEPAERTPGDAVPGGTSDLREDAAVPANATGPRDDEAAGEAAGDDVPAGDVSDGTLGLRGDTALPGDTAVPDEAAVPGDAAAFEDAGEPQGDDASADVPADVVPAGAGDPPGDDPVADGGGRSRRRAVLAQVTTALACLFVLFALIVPDHLDRLTPGAFVRVPVEALLGVGLVLVLRAGARRAVAVLAGVGLGLLLILKIIDMGFFTVLDRPFNPVLDFPFIEAGVEFLSTSYGGLGAIATVIAVVALAIAVLVLMALSVLRVTRVVVRHETAATRAVVVLGVGWVVCAVLGAQVVPGVPVAGRSAAGLAYKHAIEVRAGIGDQKTFAREAAVDPFRNTPGKDLLTGLRGKDVVLSFVESYGRVAVSNPELAPQVGAVLDAGTRRLNAAGFSSRSAFLTSPTSGAGSWLAHSTLLSGLWINNQQRYRSLVGSDRLTLTGAFRRANWRTVGVMAGNTRDWPEAKFYGHDKIYDARNLGYRGAPFNWGTPPDQYTLATFERTEREKLGRPPVMAEIPLVSSHAPWTPVPKLIDWKNVGDGSAFTTTSKAGVSLKGGWRSATQVRADYRRSIEYSLSALISYVENYGDDDLVLIFLGDHQPATLVTGEHAGRDVPITIVARDKAVLDRVAGWNWQEGLKPNRRAPVWRMDTFRDRFLTAFGTQPTTRPAHPTR